MGGAIAACRRGAIVPNTSEGFDQVEASASPEHAVNVVKFESVQSDPAPRRRRGGRRVVRGVGAAGASLELKVEEHASAPLFEEPKLPVAQPAHDTGDSADSEGMTRPTRRRRRPVQSDDDVREIADERPTRSRRRRSVQVEDEQDEDRPSRRRSRFADDADEYDEMPRRRASVDDSHDEESSVERALDAVDMLPEGHEVRHNPRPMMSLLSRSRFCRPLRIPETGQTTIATIPVMTAASVMIAMRRTMRMSRMRIVRHVAVAAAIATLPTKSVPKTIAMNAIIGIIAMMMRTMTRKADLASRVVPVV